jgi:uncharacterized protein YbjQ (UPF0145 family)
MIVSTTTAIDGRPVIEYVGVATGEAVLGANVFRDLFAGLRDIVGGRSAGYERSLWQARETAIGEMVAEAEQLGADAVIVSRNGTTRPRLNVGTTQTCPVHQFPADRLQSTRSGSKILKGYFNVWCELSAQNLSGRCP